jgi:hypothetical protein
LPAPSPFSLADRIRTLQPNDRRGQAKTKPLEEAREMLKGSRLDLDAEDKPSPTSTIWKFKEQPGWK